MKPSRLFPGLLSLLAGVAPADAAEFHWNNTIELSAIYQTDASATIEQCTSPAAVSCTTLPVVPAGQFHWTSDLDVSFQDFGARIGATAWYATSTRAEYTEGNVPIFSYASPGYKYLTVEASDSAQGNIDLSDAYIYDTVPLGDGQPLTFKVGRQTLLWGESRYFIGNGIAAGQAPIDTDLSEATHYGSGGSDIFLPVGQASFSWQPTGNLAIAGYYQFEWRPSVIGSAGGYAGIANLFGPDKTPVIYLSAPYVGPLILRRRPDQSPGSTDQYGGSLKWHDGDFDYGVYGLSFNAKTPVFYFHPPALGTTPPLGTYSLEYPKAIQLYGISLGGPLGGASFGAEFSIRRRMPLVNNGVFVPLDPGLQADNNAHPLYPLGDTMHAQFSWLYSTPPLPWIPGGADWSGEIAANGLLDKTANPNEITPGRTRYAAALRTVFEPKFFQVLPQVDISLPLSLGYNLFGLSSVDSTINRGTGDVGAGVSATIDQTWRTALSFTHYFGQARNPLLTMDYATAGAQFSASDYIMVSVSRSF